MKKVCRICGVDSDHHHKPNWIFVPAGCICDPLTWDGNRIPKPCKRYVGNGRENCRDCEHDKGCHETLTRTMRVAETGEKQ